MFRDRFSRRVSLTLVLAGNALLPGPVLGQSGWFAEPSFSMMQIYDDNILFSDLQAEEDSIVRLSPAVNTGYRSVPLTLNGRFSVDAEHYRRHPELDSDHARKNAEVNIDYRANGLLTLSADGSYLETQTPGELTPETGLELGRARAERLALGSGALYRFDSVTTGAARYDFSRYELADGIDSEVHVLGLNFDRRLSRRDAVGFDYRFDGFRFDTAESVDAHTVLFRVSRELTPRTAVSLGGGPRFFEGDIDPEVSASWRYKLERGQVEMTYEKSQTIVIGRPGATAVESIGAAFNYSFGAYSEMRIASSTQSSRFGGLEADVFAVNFEVSHRITRYLTLIGAYGYSSQHGNLDTPAFGEITRNVAWLGLVVAPPPRKNSRAASRLSH